MAFAFLDHPGPIPFAHRGGASEAPENTLPAFAHAVGLGYRYLETDVHVTSDGVLLAFHDDRLDRVTDRTGVIAEMTWAEVALARVDGREPIPRFADLLDAFPQARINIDPKADDSVEPLVAAIRDAGAIDRVCIGSFSDERIERCRAALGPGLCTSLGPKGIAALRARSWVGFPRGRPPAPCAQVPTRFGKVAVLDRRFVDTAHDQGVMVHVWTIDDPDEMHHLLDLGVDGIMTDRPQVLKDVLVARGVWVG